MQLAARFADTWVTTGDRGADAPLPPVEGAAVVRRQIDALDDACASTGRDPATLNRLVLTGLRLDSGTGSERELADTIAHYTAAGVTDFVVHWPRAGDPFAGDAAAFERVFAART
jgi:alkanesulfonate monooxygenase SsuD/methylene tetrahydromethanopterin reductase-like flavin-dependent oxidoreductase (luciferase family)